MSLLSSTLYQCRRSFKSVTAWVVFSLVGVPLQALPQSPTPSPNSETVDLDRVGEWLKQLPEPAQRGYRNLTERAYLPHDLDEQVFEQLVARLPADDQRASSDTTARQRVFDKYGLTRRWGDETGKPLQYVVDDQQHWVMNCFACHGGSVYGTPLPGAPNNAYQLQTFTEDVRATKLRLGKSLGHMDLGSVFMPLGTSVGTTNAVMFGVALMNYRDADLNVQSWRPAPRMVNHDMDPPPWWHFHRKQRIYIDGFAQKGSRGLMQFMLVKENGAEKFRAWESDFEDVYAFIESLRAPRYPKPVDQALAARGRLAFESVCARCHGTYGTAGSYKEQLVPIYEVRTDRVRLDALTAKHRASYGNSWFAHYGEHETWADPGGYVAPPLDGVWASAPYFHNGSVPTLWHVLHPDQRPKLWKRSATDFNEPQVGMQVTEFSNLPEGAESAQAKRLFFDASQYGKSNAGHDFALELSEDQRAAVLEYLKTL